MDSIRESGKLSDDDLAVFKDAITEFKKGFTTSSGQSLAKEAAVAAMDDEDVDQETITKVKKA